VSNLQYWLVPISGPVKQKLGVFQAAVQSHYSYSHLTITFCQCSDISNTWMVFINENENIKISEYEYAPFWCSLIVSLSAGDLTKMKDASFTIAEGCFYQLRISFYVQREIVTGLKYQQQSYRAGIRGMLWETLCFCYYLHQGGYVFIVMCVC